jgi:hypothetical protein
MGNLLLVMLYAVHLTGGLLHRQDIVSLLFLGLGLGVSARPKLVFNIEITQK